MLWMYIWIEVGCLFDQVDERFPQAVVLSLQADHLSDQVSKHFPQAAALFLQAGYFSD